MKTVLTKGFSLVALIAALALANGSDDMNRPNEAGVVKVSATREPGGRGACATTNASRARSQNIFARSACGGALRGTVRSEVDSTERTRRLYQRSPPAARRADFRDLGERAASAAPRRARARGARAATRPARGVQRVAPPLNDRPSRALRTSQPAR